MSARAKNALFMQKLDWKIDTKQLFSLVSHQPWAILLDSANAPHQDAKFDIIGFNPIATLTSSDGVCQFSSKDPAIETLNIKIDSEMYFCATDLNHCYFGSQISQNYSQK